MRAITVQPGATNSTRLEDIPEPEADDRHFRGRTPPLCAHCAAVARALRDASREWLERLIAPHGPPARFEQALENRPDDIEVIVDFTGAHAASY